MNEIVITLAKAAIYVALGKPDTFDLENALKHYPALNENGAVFVTITTKKDHRLRGCIGSLEAYRPLYKDIILNAQSAALHDPRFVPMKAKELDQISIEVSLLNKPVRVDYPDINALKKTIRPDIDGVILQYHTHRATFLPSVWEELPDFDDFFKKNLFSSLFLHFFPFNSAENVVRSIFPFLLFSPFLSKKM